MPNLHLYSQSESVAQWLEHLTGHQKVAGSIPVWDSEIIFLIELDDLSSIISRDLQTLTILTHKFHQYHY